MFVHKLVGFCEDAKSVNKREFRNLQNLNPK